MPAKFDRILAALDLGPGTPDILAYARLLAAGGTGREDSLLTLLHVMDYALTPPAYLVPYMEREEEEAGAKLEALTAALRSDGIASGYRIVVGRLVDAFNTFVRDSGADILVIGHKAHLINPSSSERLIKSLDIPMLVVRGKRPSEAGPQLKRVLCAVDFSEDSLKALEAARELAGRFKAALTTVHVVSLAKKFLGRPDVCEEDRCRYRDERMNEALQRLTALETEGAIKVGAGAAYEEINRAAVESGADLVVVGARGLSYLAGIMLGSVSEALIKSAPCPVMVVR